jgi:hypothetical protein
MVTIIKNDIQRVFKYLSGEIKPYIKVYGKKYNVMGTPFERVFTSFKMLPQNFKNIQDNSDYRAYENILPITTPQQFKEFLVNIYRAAEETDDASNGDSRLFPQGDYNPVITDINDLSDNQKTRLVSDFFDFQHDYQDQKYKFVKISDLNLKPDDEEESEDDTYDFFENDLDEVWWYDSNFENRVYRTPISAKDTHYVMIKNGTEFVDLDDDDLKKDIQSFFIDNVYEYNWKEIELDDKKFNILKNTDDMNYFTNKIFKSEKFISYLRRYFRNNDWIVNNTKLDTNKRFDNYQSISKKSITQNAIKLKKILSEFLLYVKTNFDKVKADYKRNKSINKKYETFSKENGLWLADIINNLDTIYNLNMFEKEIDIVSKETSSNFDKLKKLHIKRLLKIREYPKQDLIFYLKNTPETLEALGKSYSEILKFINMIYSDNVIDMINECYNLHIKVTKLYEIFKKPQYKNQLNLFYKDFLRKNYVKKYDTSGGEEYENNFYNTDKRNQSIDAFKIDLQYNINKSFLNKFNENLNKDNKFFKITLNCDISRWDVEHYSYKAETEQNLFRIDLSSLVKYQISIINVLSILNP